jgi:hypothetical protein
MDFGWMAVLTGWMLAGSFLRHRRVASLTTGIGLIARSLVLLAGTR